MCVEQCKCCMLRPRPSLSLSWRGAAVRGAGVEPVAVSRASVVASPAESRRAMTSRRDHVTTELSVRLATRPDMAIIHGMIQELAAYEGMPDGPQITVDDLILDGFESSPAWFFALVVSRGGDDGEVVGYALCNRAYSSWTRRALYVEDLYVRGEARRSGAGRALLRRLCALAAADGVTRIDWHVLESNTSALAFYSGLGARDLRRTEGRAAMRLDEPYIKALAAEDTGATADIPH